LNPRLDRLALGCLVLWPLGAALTPWVGLWGGIATTALALGVLCLLLARDALAPLLRPTPRLLALGVIAGLVMLLVTYAAYPPLSRSWTLLGAGVPPLYAAFRSPRPAWLFLALPLVVVAEELAWRGVVFEALRRRLPPLPAVIACAVLYAGAHAPAGSLVLTGVALACGVFWSALRASTRSLVPCTLAHLIWDLTVMMLRPLDGR
jgi:CAAX protease family protein